MPDRVLKFWEKFSKAPRAIDHEHAKIHDGDAYTMSVQQSLTSAGSFGVLFTAPSSNSHHLRTVRINPEAGPLLFNMYEDPVIDVNSLGTEIPLRNMNRQSSKVSSLQVYTDPVTNVASLGVELENELIPASGVQGGGSASPTPFEFVLKRDSNYLMVFGSQGGNTQFTYTIFVYQSISA